MIIEQKRTAVSMNTISRVALIGCVSLTLLGGCAFARGSYGEEVAQGNMAAIKKGVSTRADVAALLGAPDRIIEANGHEFFHYYHFDVKSGFFSIIILTLTRTNIKSDDIFIVFDRNGLVEEVVAGKKKPNLEFQIWPFDWPFGP